MAVTHFKQVDWIVAWDGDRESHTYIRGGDLAFEDNTSSARAMTARPTR